MASSISLSSIHQQIKTVGGRLTKTRLALLDILFNADCLVSKDELQKKMKQQRLQPDRSTLHRELIFLLAQNIIRKNIINGVDYFEMARHHHHHLICLACHHIQHVEGASQADCHITHLEKNIAQQKNFVILNHSLEYYGYCQDCQT